MRANPKSLSADCSGAVAVEYGLIGVIIVIGLISLQSSIGNSISGFFMAVANGL